LVVRCLSPLNKFLAMKNLTIAYLMSATLACSCFQLPSFAQAYNESFGGSRVIYQNQTGLFNPSSTYIGAGTLSRSAQGKGAGIGGALPAVNMGSHVRTPGDNLYNNDGTDRLNNGALVYQDQEQEMMRQDRHRYQTALARQRALDARNAPRPQPQGNLYVPGSNGGTAGYDSVVTPQVNFRGNGTATYGDSSAKTRSF
jgi:hypothetical protein